MGLTYSIERLAAADRRIPPLLARAREFRARYIEPVAAELDRRLLLDPNDHPDDLLRAGCRYGFLSLPIPTFLGGGGMISLHAALLLEELSAGCAGIANLFGAHYLGIMPPLMGLDVHLLDEVLVKVAAAEKRGEPLLFAAAVTEPTAGTDVEDAELLPKAKLGMSARRVEGGYLLNGRKVFISNGSLARYHSVICAVDRAAPLETWSAFLVESGTPGFSVGRVERKMGQRACPASELVFEDCFLPTRMRIGTEGRAMEMTGAVLAASRAPVAAIATGIARGAMERAVAFARERRSGGGRLVDRPWARQLIADMASKVALARSLALEAALLFDETVTRKLLGRGPWLGAFLRLTGPLRRTRPGRALTSSEPFKRLMVRRATALGGGPAAARALGLSSLAKFSASDLAVEVCLKALTLCGPEGADERLGVEKSLRDAKLTQIYEGTNQLNRLAAAQALRNQAPPWTI